MVLIVLNFYLCVLQLGCISVIITIYVYHMIIQISISFEYVGEI